MSDTPSTPSHGKKFRWRKSYLLLVPLLLLVGVELFVDPFPRSIWALRVLNTKYLVHVRADLTVDGEPLVMDRTIRCFNPVDFFWYPGAPPHGDVRASNGQAGDTLAAVTSKGRLFAINVPDACGALGSRLREDKPGYTWTDPATHDVTPLHLSRNEIETPVLYEIHGGRHPKQIDAYIARDLLRQGYHGVQLNELVVEKTSGLLLKDWNGYEWFTTTQWLRHSGANRLGRYRSRHAFIIPEERWGEVMEEIRSFNPDETEWLAGMSRMLDSYRTLTTDSPITSNNPFLKFHNLGRQRHTFGDGYTQSHLQLPMIPVQIGRQRYQWFLGAMFPCLPIDPKQQTYACRPDLYGVVSSVPHVYTSTSPWVEHVVVNDIRFDAPNAIGYFLAVSPRRAYGFSQ